MSQQQPANAGGFSAFKPSTWGQVKNTWSFNNLRSKIVGINSTESGAPAGSTSGKENQSNAVGLNKVISKPQGLGLLQDDRGSSSQRYGYVLQPNFLGRPAGAMATGVPSASVLGIRTAPAQKRHQPVSQQPLKEPSKPSSPAMRGRQPLGLQNALNPNFNPGSVSTRLPTPVRIRNREAPPVSSNGVLLPLVLPKPPSPARSLSLSGAAPTSFACGSVPSSPTASTVTGEAHVRATGSNLPCMAEQASRSSALLPWAKAPVIQTQATSSVPSRAPAVAQSRSILASMSLSGQSQPYAAGSPLVQQQEGAADEADTSLTPQTARTSPAMQAALRQAMQAAIQRHSEDLGIVGLTALFDQAVAQDVTGKRERAQSALPSTSVPARPSAGIGHGSGAMPDQAQPERRTARLSPFAAAPAQQQAVSQEWSVEDAPLSEACCRALDVARYGLAGIYTSAGSSRSTSAMGGRAVSNSASVNQPQPKPHGAVDLEDTAVSKPKAADTTALLSHAAEALNRHQADAVEACGQGHSQLPEASPCQQASAVTFTANAPALQSSPNRHQPLILPSAAAATLTELLSPNESRSGTGETNTAASTPVARTPRSHIITAASTPTGGQVASAVATPTTNARLSLESPIGDEARGLQSPDSCSSMYMLPPAALFSAACKATPAGDAAAALDCPQAMTCEQSPHTAVAQPAASTTPQAAWSPMFPAIIGGTLPSAASAMAAPSPITFTAFGPSDLPTPACFTGTIMGAPGLAAAVKAVIAQPSVALPCPVGSSTAAAGAPSNPLQELMTEIEKLSTLKEGILAEDKPVDVQSIAQLLRLKLTVDGMVAHTGGAARVVGANVASSSAGLQAAGPLVAAEAPLRPVGKPEMDGTPQKKLSRSASIGNFLARVFSPRRSASKNEAAPAAATASICTVPAATCAVGPLVNSGTVIAGTVILASPARPVGGAVPVRPSSASAAHRRPASPGVDKGRFAALHQRASAALAAAGTERAAASVAATNAVVAPAGAQTNAAPSAADRVSVRSRYEHMVSTHRQQLDTTKSQLDNALLKLGDMQVEFDELLLCLGMESAKNQALCDAMRAAGLDPEPILAAIEEQWLPDM